MSKTGKLRKTSVPPEVANSLADAISMRCRRRIEEVFGWNMFTARLAQMKVHGLQKVRAIFIFGLSVYNPVRLPTLLQRKGEVCLEEGK